MDEVRIKELRDGVDGIMCGHIGERIKLKTSVAMVEVMDELVGELCRIEAVLDNIHTEIREIRIQNKR